MTDRQMKCPFAAPLTKGRFACRHAEEVVRRGGSEYDCRAHELERRSRRR